MDSYSLILTVFRDILLKKESIQSVTILSPQITSSLERKDQLRGSDLAVPAVVRVMHENGFATQPLLVLLEFRLGLHCPLPPSLPPSLLPHPNPPHFYHPSVFGANGMSNNPNIPNTPESYTLTGAWLQFCPLP